MSNQKTKPINIPFNVNLINDNYNDLENEIDNENSSDYSLDSNSSEFNYRSRSLDSTNNFVTKESILSKSWSDFSPSEKKFIKYDVFKNAQGAGIIPYTIHNGELLFLFQKTIFPDTTKNRGWNDFGGKKDDKLDNNAKEIACREFSEETSCIFYLKENATDENNDLFSELTNTNYSSNTIDKLKDIFKKSTDYYTTKLNKYDLKFNLHIKEIYVSYFLHVPYVNADSFPKSEDIHLEYDYRYIRQCKWFKYDDIIEIDENEFHKRLQIMKIKNKIQDLWHQRFFIRYILTKIKKH
jgi:hypothetical protein